MRRRRKTKILATLGPASNTPQMMRALFDAGVDVFRINMSHTSHEMLAKMHGQLRALSEEVGRPIGILIPCPIALPREFSASPRCPGLGIQSAAQRHDLPRDGVAACVKLHPFDCVACDRPRKSLPGRQVVAD